MNPKFSQIHLKQSFVNLAYSTPTHKGKMSARAKITDAQALTFKALYYRHGMLAREIVKYFPDVDQGNIQHAFLSRAYKGLNYNSRCKMPDLYYQTLEAIEADKNAME